MINTNLYKYRMSFMVPSATGKIEQVMGLRNTVMGVQFFIREGDQRRSLKKVKFYLQTMKS